ncbi:MAG: hypothetical protein RLZZ628_3575, partial [Bacteroidota bacterium]
QTGSFLSSFERMDGTINALHFIAFFWVVGSVKLSDNQWKIILIMSCFVALGVTIFGMVESEHSDDGRIQSTLSNPLYVAIYLIFHIFLLINVFINIIKTNNLRSKFLTFLYSFICIIVFALLLYVIVYTKSRSAVISLVFGLIVATLLIGFLKQNLRKYALTGIVFIASIIAILYFNRNSEWVQSDSALARITNLSVLDNSISARKELWEMTLSGLPDRPIIGWGKESYIYYFAKYYSPTMYDNGFWYDRVHNFVFDKYIEGGFLGLLTYLFVIASMLYLLWEKDTNIGITQKSLITGYLVSYLVFNLTVFDSYVSLLILFFLMAYIQQKSTTKRINIKKIKSIWLVFFALIMSFVCYNVVYRTFKTNKQWTAASKSTEVLQLMTAYKQAYQDAWIGKYDVGLDFALQKDRVKSGDFDDVTKLDYYDSSEKALKELLEKYPNHPILLSQLGFIQQYAGKSQEAIKTYLLLQTIAPKRQVNLMDLAIFYLESKDFDKAIKLFDEIYQLDKSYNLALLYKAYGLSLKGDKANAKAIIYHLPVEFIVENLQFIWNVFKNNSDEESLMFFLSNTTDKSKFKRETFLVWLKIAAEKNNTTEVHSSIFSFYKHFLPESELPKINQLIEDVNAKKSPPDALVNYFE